MLKPLELTVYPPMPTTESLAPLTRDEAFRELKRASALNEQIVDKRFTNAELAAEYESARCDAMLMSYANYYWAPLGDTWSSDPATIDRRARTMLLFATLPHYDEEVTS